MAKETLLQRWLDGTLDPVSAEAFLASLPAAERREALALKRLGDLAGCLPGAVPSPGFAARAMARVRTRTPPRRTVWTWLRSPAVSPLGAVALSAALAVGAFGLAQWRARTPRVAAQAQVVARLAIQAPLAREVSVAGDFNGWKPERAKMHREPNGVWSVDLPLAAGRRYQYMFVVDGTWVTDPAAPATMDDGFGNQNAVLDI